MRAIADELLKAIDENKYYLLKLILVLVLGYLAIKLILSFINRTKLINRLDQTVRPFLVGLIRVLLYSAYLIAVLSFVGVPMTTFVAGFSAVGIAIALALKSHLANFAGAIIILIFKPFVVGDFIETQDNSGTVREIQVLFTHIVTPDNRRMILPNSDLVNKRVINYSAEPIRRIDLTFGAAYGEEPGKVKHVLYQTIEACESVLADPKPYVRLAEYGNSQVGYQIMVWVNNPDYLKAKWEIYEQVKTNFEQNNIQIPFPQREVWLHQAETSNQKFS